MASWSLSSVPAERGDGSVDLANDRLLPQVRALVARHRRLVERLSRAEELADALALDLEEIERALAGAGSAGRAPAGAVSPGLGDRGALRRTAEAGVSSLAVAWCADGAAEVRLDGGKAFRLPAGLAELLEILALDSGRRADGLVGWKTLDEVAILVGKRRGQPVRRHAVTQLVYRLRRELFARGAVNPYLVQSSRRHGVRFALRRSCGAAG
jgi:hypothetical protein